MSRSGKIQEIETNVPLSGNEIVQFLCKASDKWGVLISFDLEDLINGCEDGKWKMSEITKATNGRMPAYPNPHIHDESALFLF